MTARDSKTRLSRLSRLWHGQMDRVRGKRNWEKWDRLLLGGGRDGAFAAEPGEWYLGVYCLHCTVPIPVFKDQGRGNIIAVGSGTLTVTCPHCDEAGAYGTDGVVSFLIEDTKKK